MEVEVNNLALVVWVPSPVFFLANMAAAAEVINLALVVLVPLPVSFLGSNMAAVEGRAATHWVRLEICLEASREEVATKADRNNMAAAVAAGLETSSTSLASCRFPVHPTSANTER